MSQEFQEEIRTALSELENQVTKQKTASLRSLIVVLFGLVGHAFVAGGMWSGITHDTDSNRRLSEANANAVKVVADEQLRRTRNVDAVSEMKIDMKSLRQLMQEVRDDVILLKAKETNAN